MKPVGVTWVLEGEAFPDNHAAMQQAVLAAGFEVIPWADEWWATGRWPRLQEARVVFHGSLGNASRIRQELPWVPGTFCATERFRCSAWYPGARPWLLNKSWALTTADALVREPDRELAPLGSPDTFFVRPDSPLKPFSGRCPWW